MTVLDATETEAPEDARPELRLCMDCGYAERPAYQVPDGRIACGDCVVQCRDCGVWVPGSETTEHRCSACDEQRNAHYGDCYECDARTHEDDLRCVGGEYICSTCIDRLYTWCDGCEEYEGHQDACSNDDDTDPESLDQVHAYAHRPTFRYHDVAGVTREELPGLAYFGVELETESTAGHLADGAELVTAAAGDLVYLKADGSLHHGFEMVTHPLTLAYAQARSWDHLDDLRRLGFRSWDTDTCGIHVHASRGAFKGKAHIWRFAHLIYRNPAQSEQAAGRSSARWARFDGERREVGGVLKPHRRSRGAAMEVRGVGGDRYVAVNLQNESTVEVRIFRGSLKAARMLANLELVAAGIEYTRHLTVCQVKNGALEWADFVAYVTAHADIYPHFHHYNEGI